MKKIIGLDLGITSIGWSFVEEAEKEQEKSSIVGLGVRIVPLSATEESDFKKGNAISINAARNLKRGARVNLYRFKQRRDALLSIFKHNNFIDDNYVYAETGKETTFSSYRLRAKSVKEMITKEELVKVFLMINKKRGYKSNRKAKSAEEGEAIDGMAIAKALFEKGITPGQWVYQSLTERRKYIPDFYRSDLQIELDEITGFQQQFYPDTINEKLLESIKEKSKIFTAKYFTETLKIELAENKGNHDQVKRQHYEWRSLALKQQLPEEQLAYIIAEINNQINQSSGYLGKISDRSKALYFNKETVGEYLYKQLQDNEHAKLKDQVFYRQDYLDEFEKIWETQTKFHKELDQRLKKEVRDITIFYQRKLKSKKHLLCFCEFEKQHKVIPKSSPLFQEFRIWQNINNITLKNSKTKELFYLDEEQKNRLADELYYKDYFTDLKLLQFYGLEKGIYEVNFKKIEGNRTNHSIYKAFEHILKQEGYDTLDYSRLEGEVIKEITKSAFNDLMIDTSILEFDTAIQGDDFDKQAYYQLWHLLYAVEEDQKLKEKLCEKFGFKKTQVHHLANVSLQTEYGSLSAKAIKKILPHLKDGHTYDKACLLAGYNHSHSLTKVENENRVLKEKLSLIKKNSLRNPVVEKIINQMIHVVNAIIANPKMGRPDEIRIELARELKANNKQRSNMIKAINDFTKENERIRKLLVDDYGEKRVTKNDIIRYRLWEETGGISLYTGKTIEPSKLFSKEYDIEHIIPKSRLFDDSFSNKTLCERQFNIDKGNRTAFSYCQEKLNEDDFVLYQVRIQDLFKRGKIKYTKYKKLLMADGDIPEDFIARQLQETRFITKKAKEVLFEITRNVTPTIGSITDKLREDWELVDIMKELNWDKYHQLGLTKEEEGKNGERLYKIIDWTKRKDHRHHAMDALTVAFTKPVYIQYLNNLNAKNKEDKKDNPIYGIERKYLQKDKKGKLRFKLPMLNFRAEVKEHLERILISYKAKNKVVTKNKNTIKIKSGTLEKIQPVPRGQLHDETVYRKSKQYKTRERKIGVRFTVDVAEKVAKKQYREALLARLAENDNDPKDAFTGKNSLVKNPIYLDSEKINTVPNEVKVVTLNDIYTIRKEINPDLKIEKVVDVGIRTILFNRLKEYGNAKLAFSNLEEKPIMLNKEKGISIKRVTITGSISNAQSLRTKKDHYGNVILDSKRSTLPVDFIRTGNNHHVAVYEDEEGILREEVVSFYEAVSRHNSGFPVVNKQHEKGWEFLFSMKKNEFFVFPSATFNPQEVDLLDPANAHLISPNLFRVQKIATKEYMFRHHLETTVEVKNKLKGIAYRGINSTSHLLDIIKVRINHLGQIVQVGEY